MLGLLKSKNPYIQSARDVYGALLKQVRCSTFYEDDFSVPDTLDGRFDLLLMHIYAVMDYMLEDHDKGRAEQFNQALFDVTFSDMDQTLREMGIGDMGLPKHMRRMMKAFNGRIHAYSKAVETGDMEGALRKNLYGTVENVASEPVENMMRYMDGLHHYLRRENTVQQIVCGEMSLPDMAKEGESV